MFTTAALQTYVLVLILVLFSFVLLTPFYILSRTERGKRARTVWSPSADNGAGTNGVHEIDRDGNAVKTRDVGVSPIPFSVNSGNGAVDGITIYVPAGPVLPSAPPLALANTTVFPYYYPHHENGHGYGGYNVPPPPSYNEVLTSEGGGIKLSVKEPGENSRCDRENSYVGGHAVVSGANDLEWHQVFTAFNEKRMSIATRWAPPPVSGRPLTRCLKEVDDFLQAQTHPVGESAMYKFLKSFNALTNLVYAESSAVRRINVADDGVAKVDHEHVDITWHTTHRQKYLEAFRLLVKEYLPKRPITNRIVPFGYDWFMLTGRTTYSVINAHIVLCSLGGVETTETPTPTRPYYTANAFVDTRSVADGLKNICMNFTESLGFVRYSSNLVYVSTAFLYASLLQKACERIAAVSNERSTTPASLDAPLVSTIGAGGVMPDYMETLNEILFDPVNRYDTLDTLIEEIGKSRVPPVVGDPVKVTYDGVYDDRTFIAHRRLRMYAYIHSYCEQLLSLQLLLRQKRMNDDKLAVLLNAVEPMSAEGALFYFNLHSRKGTFKNRNGSSLFSILGISKFRNADGGGGGGGTGYGRVYVADRARILFVQSDAFTFHTIGQLSDLAYGEVERANRDLMPAWLMGQRPLFRADKNKLTDVPCGAHLEPCVIDTGKSRDLEMGLIKKRNTTNYTPTEASSAVVAFEKENIGTVYTSVRETTMDVHYRRCTVATPYYTITTFFRITRDNSDGGGVNTGEGAIRLSCYTGVVELESNEVNGQVREGDEENKVANSQGDVENRAIVSQTRFVDFKHCTVQLFVQRRDGSNYEDGSVTTHVQKRVTMRQKSKSKYTSDELKNVSLSLPPFGGNNGSGTGGFGPQPLGSVTIVIRPKDCEAAPVPKSLADRKISPRVTMEGENVYRIKVDSRYVVYCDDTRNITVLLDVGERRACIAPMGSTVRDGDGVTVEDRIRLVERASATVQKDVPQKMKYDSFFKNRIYAYFD